ncbi:unnamed protein product [Alopecurus aequalis]
MAGDDSFGHCGLFQGLCGLVEVFLLPRSGGVLAQKDGRTGPPRRDVESAPSKNSPPAARELRFDHQEEGLLPVARNSPAVGGDLCSSSSQIGRNRRMTWTRDVSSRELRFDYQEEDLSPVARDSPAAGGDLCSTSSGGSAPDVVEFSSSDEEDSPPVARELCSADHEEDLFPVSRNSPPQQNGMAGGIEDDDGDDDDDDCVILDCDPHSAVAVKGEKECGAADSGSDEELRIVAEKGQVACRDFPHSRHLCSNMPFGTTSHEKHCTMCYCFVCDAPAPCTYWGKALSVDDHCHATDKETKWKALREAFRSKNLPVSRPEEETVEYPTEMSLARLFFSNQITLPEFMTQSRHMHTSVRASLNVAPTVNAPSEGSGTSNGRSAQVNRPVELTTSAPRAHPTAGAQRGTTNTRTAQISHPRAPNVIVPIASSATRVLSDTRSAPRVYPVARAGRDSINAHSDQSTYSVAAMSEPDVPEGRTVYVGNLPGHVDNERLRLSFQQAGVVLFSKVIYDRETGRSRGFGYVTMSTAQEAEAAVRIYHGSEVYGRPLAVNIAPPRGGSRVGQVDTTRRQSGSPLKIFVCNLPSQVDRSRLEELFSEHGKVVDARVVYESREGACHSRGFGFVTMATEEETHKAIRALNKQMLEGRALVVRVGTERPQQGQNAAGQSRNTHTSGRASPNVAPSASTPRAYTVTRGRSGTSNAYTAQVTRGQEPARSS